MYDYRKDKRRKAPRSRRPEPDSLLAPGDQVLDRYIDDDGSERLVVGIHDESTHDPGAPIDEPKGETFNIGVRSLNDLPAKPSMVPCQPGQHMFEPDGEVGDEIPGHQSMKCRNCPIGQIVPAA